MKKKIGIIFLAISIGGLLAFFTLTKENKQNSLEKISLMILQTGVFANYENALAQKNHFENAIIYQEKDYFLVIVGAATNERGLTKIEDILNEKNIAYYKKKIEIIDQDQELFLKYNLLLEKAENKETVILLNQKILDRMSEI